MAAGRAMGWIAAFAAWAACIGVIAHYNIASSLDHWGDPNVRAMIYVQVLCAIVLSFIQIDRGQHLSRRGDLTVSVVLIALSVWAGMETANRFNEATNGPNADKIAKAKKFQGQIDSLNGKITALGTFKSTSAKQVEVAQNAVKEASWQTRTCGRNCDMEAKNTALSNAQNEATELASWQTKTEEKKRLDDDLEEAQDKLAGLGYVPENANKTAALIASFVSCLGATAEGVEKWLPFVRSILIEMLNRFAPGFVFLFILGLFGNVEAVAKADADSELARELAADIEAKADMPGNVRSCPASSSEDPTSPPSTRTTKKRTPKSKRDVSAKVIRFPKADDARALISEGKTKKEAADLLGVTDRTIRRWLSSLDANSRPADCPGMSGQDKAHAA